MATFTGEYGDGLKHLETTEQNIPVVGVSKNTQFWRIKT